MKPFSQYVTIFFDLSTTSILEMQLISSVYADFKGLIIIDLNGHVFTAKTNHFTNNSYLNYQLCINRGGSRSQVMVACCCM